MSDTATADDALSPDAPFVGDDSLFRSRVVPSPPALRSLIGAVGDLEGPDEHGLRLPPGFRSRELARSGQPVAGTSFVWPSAPDGGATFATADGGWIYCANSEPFINGGASSLRFGAQGTLIDAYSILTWVEVPDPQFHDVVHTRYQVPESFAFNGGEGIYHHDSLVHFSTKGDNRVWTYDIEASMVSILYDGLIDPEPAIQGADAIVVSCCGDVLVGEDLGQLRVAAILPDGQLKSLLQVVGQDSSEITGLAFDPSGTRLYFSSQRGVGDGGITYEVRGPFHEAV